ncbi:glycerophosphodiester phosphodiesterase [Diplocloster hominis]|uniref:glycerophosphodiester phosphodiesterase n=1 Tax=Diplocloster hominis TaxID=3079010 RepID=UPI0031BB9C89
MRTCFKKAREILNFNMKSLLLFEVGLHIAISATLLYLLRQGILLLLERQGYSYLTAENFLDFIKNPLTILLFSVYVIVMLFLLLFEVSVLLGCFHYSERKVRATVTDIILIGSRQMEIFVRKNRLMWLPGILTLMPFLTLHYLVRQFFNIKILNYAIQILISKIKYPVILILLFVAFLLLCTQLFLAVPAAVMKRGRVKDWFRDSRSITGRHYGRFLGRLLVWNIALVVVLSAFYFLFSFLAAVFVHFTKDAAIALGVLLKIEDWVRVGMGYVAGVVGTVCNLVLIYTMYREAAQEPGSLPDQLPDYGKSRLFRKFGRKRVAMVIGMCIAALELVYGWYLISQRVVLADDIFVTTQVTAHRGGARTAPENTMSALMNAVEELADYAEIDIQETKDGQLILLHDSSLKRTAGLNKKIWEVNYDEIRNLDAGGWFRKEFAGEPIPTLSEVLDYCKGKLNLNIEIKSNGHNEDIVPKVIGLIEEYHMEDQCIVTSMDYHFLRQVKELNPGMTTGYIMSVAYGDVSRLEYADLLSVKYIYVTESMVRSAHEAGKQVHAWTVNAKGNMMRMNSIGVDNIITDRTTLVREVLAQENADTFVELLKIALR